MSELIQDDGVYAAMPDAPATMPEKIEINGVTYVRVSGFVDEQVASFRSFQTIADRTGLSVKQAIWFVYRDHKDGCIMPD